jgi:glyoxylase-like metal-dependent hydrolase (beta-lactamase superfamily II)
MEQIASGLWWWTAQHPEWKQEVSSYALLENDQLVLFDPLVPPGDEDAFWEALDGDVEHHGPPAILITVYWHARSSEQILDRYAGSTLWAHKPAKRGLRNRVAYTDVFEGGETLPGGVEALAMHHMNEAAFWLPSHRALVLGDSVVGHDGRAELSPSSWLRARETVGEQRASVQRAMERKPKRLLLTHGGPTDPKALKL